MLSGDGDHPMTSHRPQQEAARDHPVGARRRAAQPRQQGRGPARDRPQRQAVRPLHRRCPRRRARPARRPPQPGRLPGRAARPGRRAGPGHGRATRAPLTRRRATSRLRRPQAPAEPAQAAQAGQRRPGARRKAKASQGEGAKPAKAAPADKPTPRAGTKQAKLIELLKRPEGATVEQIAAATGWQKHTIRGAISGALKKKLGLTVEATRTREVGPNKTGAKGSTTVYRIVDCSAS